ncbi:FAD:protein FMN transferase [Vulgatibacter sp.]|uniref:FAD:protein FMN transferase n=1 Tax=Vulgatibacter sp. TaxID=1971226 RepID=UPI00356353B0
MRLLACLLLATSCATTTAGPALDLPPGTEETEGALPAVVPLGDGFFAASFPTMGTEISIVLGAPDATVAARAVQEAQDELRRLDALLSEWRADSPISAVNRAAGGPPVEVPQELFDLVALALEAAERSGGAFDPTWASMRGLWRFGDAMDGTVPPDGAIEKTRRKVDWRQVRLDPEARTIALGERQALGLGGIAKGYAVDSLAAIFRQRALPDFVIRLGGDLYAAGSRNGRPWRAGIQDPRDGDATFAVVEIRDQAFSTSGDYERFFVRDGVRYHHIIDPATGRPATRSRSVTALCPDALTAEVVTKPVFILGPEKGLPYTKAQGCEVVVVDAANVVHISEGLQGRIEWRQPTP